MNVLLVLDNKLTRENTKLKTLSKYVQQHPQGWKKRWELAELLYAMGRWEQAVEEYHQVLKQQPRWIEVRLRLGKILQLMAKEAEAIEVYESALLLSRNVATQHHITGLIESCRQNYQVAVSSFESATSLEPDNAAHWLALAQVHLNLEAPVAALDCLNTVLKLNPDDITALSQSYDPLLAVGQFQEAVRRAIKVLELVPDDFQALKRLADYRSRLGLVWGEEGKQTQQLIRAALQLACQAADAYESLAYYHIFRGEWAKGVAVLQEFTEEHPNNPGGWYHYARCLFHTGDAQAGAEAILRAYGLYPNDCEIYRALCEILPVAGRLEELQPLVEEMLQRFSERWSVWATAGRALVESFKDIEGGCAVSAIGPQLQPHLADAWFRHGRVLALAGRHQEAVEALLQGWQKLPEQGSYMQSVPAAAWLGESYQALGEEATSRGWWKEARDRGLKLIDFSPATAHYWQGRALEALGDESGAMQAYRSALSHHLLYPAHAEVKEVLKQLQEPDLNLIVFKTMHGEVNEVLKQLRIIY
ncbi:MAG: tetratricopeptide repeat protein [Aphanothece sp. CMT-3BRIN-NPC111]|nr:tetratricopeptide repeat protein [Aphanothece sp. CMT-3BRIN-NPC111]